MKANNSIRLKAALLLTVFGLNTVVGFACAMGVDMGFNTSHHGNDAAKGAVHIHKDGTKHVHKPGAPKHHHQAKATSSKKDDCCKDKVIALQSTDKNFQYSKITAGTPLYFIVNSYTRISIFNTVEPDLQEYIACHFHPPPRDIRIAIQRFQI